MQHAHTNAITSGLKSIKRKATRSVLVLSSSILVLGSAAGLVPAVASANHGPSQNYSQARVVYDNIPHSMPGNVPSIGFEATSASELGGQMQLADHARKNPKVTVLMSSWACKSGTWNNDNCITNPGSTFTHPVTLNVYNVNSDDSVGSLITSETKTFTMPYRPTADDGTHCNAADGTAGEWWDGQDCNNGKAFDISYDLKGTTLPDDVIVSVAYNTTHNGYSPIGDQACNSTSEGCPYDSLNVGTNPAPSKGTQEPTANDAYYNTSYGPYYCDGGTGGTGTFRLDSGCWTGFLPAFRVEASGNVHHHKHYEHRDKHHQGDKNRHHKYDSKRGFYSQYKH